MVLRTSPIPASEFDHFTSLPENADRHFELIAGEMVEKMVSHPRSSRIGLRVGGRLAAFVEDHGLGVVTGADGGYVVGEERYIPDAAYISKQRQPVPPSESYNPLPPDLAVEVLSPTDVDRDLRLKLANYMAAGTVVWVIDPELQRVEVYISGQPPKALNVDETLDGGAALPGFHLPLSVIFAE